MHQLDGACERVTRAREHLGDLKPQINALRQAEHNRVSLDRKPGIFTLPDGRKVPAVMGRLSRLMIPAPLRVRTLIGEVVQSLRVALDYLVYELACFDAKGVVNGTQFPVADTEEKFKKALVRYNLKNSLTPDHIAMIKRLQPFDGCHWTGLLASLSNPDKHRHLTAVQRPVTVTLLPGSAEAILAGKPMRVQHDVAIYITFSDGTPVIEGLEQLQSHVAQTLDAFNPEFK